MVSAAWSKHTLRVKNVKRESSRFIITIQTGLCFLAGQIVEGLNRINGFTCHCPKGAFYVFPCIKEFGMTSDEFATRFLQEEKVAVVPGTAFGDCGEGFIRISYAYSLEKLKIAIARLEKFVNKLREEQKQ